MKDKKVAFLINSLSSGGAEKIVLTIAEELHKKHSDIEIICVEKNTFYDNPNNIKITYLSNQNGKEHGLKKLLFLPIFAYKLKKYILKNNISIVNSHLYRVNYINVLAKIFGSKHLSQIVNHGIASRYKKKGMLGKINLFLLKNLYSKSDLIILISKAMQVDINNLYKFNNRQQVINNPYNIEKISKEIHEKVTEFNFKKEKTYLITVGRLVPLKRYNDVIKTVSLLNESIELIMLGNGPMKEELENLSISLNIQDRIHFLGNVSNPYKYIDKSNIFILSSETEGFPNSLIEALACEVPVISSDCISGPREILAPDTDINKQLANNIEIAEYGILYPVGNIEKLKYSINLILNKDEIYNQLTKNSLSRAKDFSVNKIIKKYMKVLYEEKNSYSN